MIKTVNQFGDDARSFVSDSFSRFQSTENFTFFSLSSFQQIFGDLDQSLHTFDWTSINQQLTSSAFASRYFNLNSIWVEKFKASKKSLSKSLQLDQISVSLRIDASSQQNIRSSTCSVISRITSNSKDSTIIISDLAITILNFTLKIRRFLAAITIAHIQSNIDFSNTFISVIEMISPLADSDVKK